MNQFYMGASIFCSSLKQILDAQILDVSEQAAKEPQYIGDQLSVKVALLSLMEQVYKYFSASLILIKNSDAKTLSTVHVIQRSIYEGVVRASYLIEKQENHDNKRIFQLYFGQGHLENWSKCTDLVKSEISDESLHNEIEETLNLSWFYQELQPWNLAEGEIYDPLEVLLDDKDAYNQVINYKALLDARRVFKKLLYKNMEREEVRWANSIWPSSTRLRKSLEKLFKKHAKDHEEISSYSAHFYKYTSSFVHPNVSNMRTILTFDEPEINDIYRMQFYLVEIIFAVLNMGKLLTLQEFQALSTQMGILYESFS